jgi:predicted DNA-binding transcriptional regulator AlpA
MLMSYYPDMDKMFTTAQVAKEVGINQRTLLRWLYAREIPEPQRLGDIRVWTKEELNFVKLYKEQNYRKRS